jgi:outer membrane protein
MSLRKVALTVGLGLALLIGAGCGEGGAAKGPSAAVKKVASIDESAIYAMDEFKKAKESLDKWADDEVAKRRKAVESKPDAEKDAAFQQFQLELQKKEAETLNPLKDKARAAIAVTAKEKGVTVVLDKKIVVYGVPDITEDVKTLLGKGGTLEYPNEEIDPAQSPIGYFDQDVVRNLKAFKEAELAIAQERATQIQKIQAEFEKQGRRPTPAEMQNIQQTLEARLQAMQEQKMGPLVKAVTDSVAEVAKTENLSLVLDTQHVMHGGRNLTELVVDNFLKKVDGAGATTAQNPPAASGSPSPVATPASGG